MAATDSHIHALPAGYEFEGYRIERVLGSGGFGITYKGEESLIHRPVAIKEYLPSSIAARGAGGLSVQPLHAGDAELFRWGLKKFRNEARTLVAFHHPNIVGVYRYFEANGTAYLVMAFEEGLTLAEILKQAGTLSEAEIHEFLAPLLDGVAEVHRVGFLHRDIKPANIVIREGRRPVLIDFGAARLALGTKSQGSKAILSPGYAPFEQYTTLAEQGPYTDIYALGATLYVCVTGARPIEAPDRVAGIPMVPALEAGSERYSKALLRAIDHALALRAEDRPQSVAAWRAELAPEAAVSQGQAPSDTTITPAVRATARPAWRRAALIAGIAIGVGAAAAGAYEGIGAYLDDARARAAADTETKRADAARAEQERREAPLRRQAEAAAERARDSQRKAQAATQLALAAKQQAEAAAECARDAAARARAKENGYYSGKFTRGERYEGAYDHRAERAHGCGILIDSKGARVEGQFADGWLQGYAVATSPNGERREGSFKREVFDGYGVWHFADGEYQGAVANGVRAGPGTFIFSGRDQYEGEFRDQNMGGFGVYRWANGELYEGEWSGDKQHGRGIQTDPTGKKIYGRWDKGKYEGID